MQSKPPPALSGGSGSGQSLSSCELALMPLDPPPRLLSPRFGLMPKCNPFPYLLQTH